MKHRPTGEEMRERIVLFIFLYTQQCLFYEYLPVPGIAAYVLAVAGFVLQYIAVFAFAAWRWDKQRLHRD